MPKIGTHHTRAEIVSGSFDKVRGTVDVVFATDTPVLMRDWDGEMFYEILSFDPAHVDMSRMNAGAPVYDNHRSWGGTEAQKGVVEHASIENNKRGLATLLISNSPSSQDFRFKVEERVARNISVGYSVQKYERLSDAADGIPQYRAIRWTPKEVSFAPMNADINSAVRNENDRPYSPEIIDTIQNRNTMPDQPAAPAAQPAAAQPAAPVAEGQRSAQPAAPAAQPAAAQPAAPVAEGGERNTQPDATATERTRCAEITEAGEQALIPADKVREYITAGHSADKARKDFMKLWAERDNGGGGQNRSITMGTEAITKKRGAMEQAILLRSGNDDHLSKEERTELRSNEYRNMSLIEMAVECIEERTRSGYTRGMSKREIAELALCGRERSGGGALSTSDFPILLGNTVNRVLRAEYELQERTFTPFSRQSTAKDFRPKTLTQISEGDDIDLIPESGEYGNAKFTDAGVSYSVKKYGKIIPITWETIIQDDLSFLDRMPAKIAEMCARKQNDIVWALILGNPVMGDTYNLFDATHHGNVAATPGAITVDNMGLLRKLMRKQKGLAGKTHLNIAPKYLVVGPDNEQLAMQYTSLNFVPTTAGGQNIWANTVTPIIEPRFDDYANASDDWFFIADPRRIDTIEYAFLEGEQDVFTEQRVGFEVDGIQIKARMVFGAQVVDYRGFAKNAGS
jgi:hypothetical protein